MRTREHRQKHVDGCHARRMKLRYACGEANGGQTRLFRQGARYQFHVTNFGHVGPECHAARSHYSCTWGLWWVRR